MPQFSSLDIQGYQNRPLPNTFVRPERAAESAAIALLFPGYRYRATMPVLYYTEQLLLSFGIPVLRVETAYDREADYQSASDKERQAWFSADVEAAAAAAWAQEQDALPVLVGKSIGTLALAHLITHDPHCADAVCIWLTPLFKHPLLRAAIRKVRPASFFAVGSADDVFDRDILTELEELTHGESIVIDGADHSLVIEDEPITSVSVLARMLSLLELFLLQHGLEAPDDD